MALVPVKLLEKIAFFQSHLIPFAQHAAELGLSDDEVAELTDLVEDARAAALAQEMAQDAARSATGRYNMAVEKMARAGATVIMKIRTRAESTGDTSIYGLAHIPQPAQRSPMPEPGLPTSLKTQLLGSGSLELTWACKNPRGSSGTTYYLSRCTDESRVFTFLGIAGEKRFVDKTIPKGTSKVTYQIQAVRSTKTGKIAEFPVNFVTTIKSIFNITPRRTMIAA